MKQSENFQAYLDELSDWIEYSNQNGSLEFAYRNGFYLHAVSLWIGSGESNLGLPLKIDRAAELKEIKQLCASADIFICPHCNHHSFFEPGEIEEDETCCESCLKTMKIDSRGKS